MRTGSLLRAVLWRLFAVVLLVGLAVALRAGDPQDADDTGWRLDDLVDRGQAPLAVAAVLWLVVVLVVVGLGLRDREGRPGSSRRRRSAVASLGLFVFFVLLAWLLQRARDARRAGAPPAEATPPDRTAVAPGDAATQGDPGLVLLVALALVAVVAITLVARRRRPVVAPADDDEPALAEGLEAAARSLRRTRDEEPRERVVAAYEAFEQALASRGVERGRSGTPAALLTRAVAAGAPEQPAAELTRLFGLARFGVDPVTQDDVRSAERAVDALLVTR